MRKLKTPTIVFSDVYDDCIATINNIRKPHFNNLKTNVVALSNDYVTKANAKQLHLILTDTGMPPLKSKDFKYLYTGKMLPKDGLGRKYYDKLMLSAINRMCPYCDFQLAEQLDHVMAKNHYSTLSITPENLVPICGSCNFLKLDNEVKVASDLHLHPYFDEEIKEQWLHARVIPLTASITFEFYVQPITSGDPDLNARIKTHFDTFDLKKRYEINSASTLSTTLDLIRLYNQNPLSLKNHLISLSEDLLNLRPNFWKTAMYCALRDSDWFCNGGVLNINS